MSEPPSGFSDGFDPSVLRLESGDADLPFAKITVGLRPARRPLSFSLANALHRFPSASLNQCFNFSAAARIAANLFFPQLGDSSA